MNVLAERESTIGLVLFKDRGCGTATPNDISGTEAQTDGFVAGQCVPLCAIGKRSRDRMDGEELDCRNDSKQDSVRSVKARLICSDGKQKLFCKECGGSSICIHSRQKQECKECGGSSICSHGKRKQYSIVGRVRGERSVRARAYGGLGSARRQGFRAIPAQRVGTLRQWHAGDCKERRHRLVDLQPW